MLYVFLLILFIYLVSVAFCVVVQRPVFAIYNRHSNTNGRVTLKDLIITTMHGLRTDCIAVSYLTALPLIALWVYCNYPHFNILAVLSCIFAITGLAVALGVVADTALYDFWHSKIDSSVLSYLRDFNDFKGIFASVSASFVALGVLAVIVIATAWTLIFYLLSASLLSHASINLGLWSTIGVNMAFVAILALLFVVLRGLGVRPNTPSIAHFSPNQFLNHSALNGIYNFIYSLSLSDDYNNKFIYCDQADAEATVASLYPRKGNPQTQLLNTNRPNILMIVWESLSSRFVEPLGGTPGVTPRLNAICNESILFTQCDCSSFLTDRGLACVLAGLPGQPTASVGKHSNKLAKLPGLPKSLLKEGYKTSVVHAGDMNIRQINEFFLASGHTTLIGDVDFPSNNPSCKWGYHDEVACNRVYDEIMQLTDKGDNWFMTFLTLSSHEPFVVPYKRLDDKMQNAFAYTDECIGNLIDRLKASPAWKDLLVVIVGDHGVHHSAEYGQQLPRHQYTRIPLLFTGGAVKTPMKIDRIVSQTDIAATILGQMDIDHKDFPFSRDVMADSYVNEFSFHAYNNGISVRTPQGFTDFDNTMMKAVDGADPEREDKARKVLQVLYKYLSDL